MDSRLRGNDGGCANNKFPSMKILLRSALFLTTALAAIAATAATPDLTLRYQQPAANTPEGWEREALPIGNGRIGAMIFGQLARERLQFNDITLWTGDDKVMGAYQPFGDLYVNLPGHDQGSTNYARRLDIGKSMAPMRPLPIGRASRSQPSGVLAAGCW